MKTKNKSYCYKCGKEVDYVIKDVKQKINIGDEVLKRTIKRGFCVHCGCIVPVPELDIKANHDALDFYRRKKRLLTAKEIKEIRTKRGLTQTELANLLGLGEKTITRYENGQIQDKAYDILLRIICNDDGYNLIKKITKNKNDNQKEASYDNIMKDIKKYVSYVNKQNKNLSIKKVIVKSKNKDGFKLKELIIN